MGRAGVRTLAFAFVLSLQLPALAGAAEKPPEITVRAATDKTEVELGEMLNFSIIISGSIKESPVLELGRLEGFHVVSSGQSQQLRLEGGRMKQTLVLTYTLAASEPGTHTLQPVEVRYQSKVLKTEPIEIKVTPRRPRLKGGVVL